MDIKKLLPIIIFVIACNQNNADSPSVSDDTTLNTFNISKSISTYLNTFNIFTTFNIQNSFIHI